MVVMCWYSGVCLVISVWYFLVWLGLVSSGCMVLLLVWCMFLVVLIFR